MTLRLRPYTMIDEHDARTAQEVAVAEDSMFLINFDPEKPWAEFLESLEEQRLGLNPSEYRVRGVQLAAEVENVLVGRASVRFELNEFFATEGGHIGYVVLPEFRRRGYASEILRQALVIARDGGVWPVLLYCGDDNVASRKVIEHCGGVLEEVISNHDGGPGRRKYWIN